MIKRLRYFLLPNLKRILSKKIVFASYPKFDQITVCEGLGRVFIGNSCYFGCRFGGFNRYGTVELQARTVTAEIKIGDDVWTNNNIMLCSVNYIEIGSRSLIGQNVVIMDHEAHCIDPSRRREIGEIGKVIIGENVWIGNNVTILKNTFIGENSVVATGAVVSGTFPPNVVLGGVPARIIKEILC